MTLEWLRKFNETLATLDAERWIHSYWLPDAISFFGNSAPCCGHVNLLGQAKAQFADLASVETEILSIDVLPSRTYATQVARYRVRDDPDDELISVNQLFVYHRAPSDARISRCDCFADFQTLRTKIRARHAKLAAAKATSTTASDAQAPPQDTVSGFG